MSLDFRGRLGGLGLQHCISFCFGLFLITISPYNYGFFGGWRLGFLGSYGLYIFDIFAAGAAVFVLLIYCAEKHRLKIFGSERYLFCALALVIASRIISLLFAEVLEWEQYISVLRYVEVLVLVYIFADFFSAWSHRLAFVWGLMLGVALETAGGLWIYLTGGDKGVFFSTTTFVLQVFALLALGFYFADRRRRVWALGCGLALAAAVFASLIRTALLFLPIAIILGLLAFIRPLRIRPAAAFSFFMVIAVAGGFLLVAVLPLLFQFAGIWPLIGDIESGVVVSRIEQASHLGGSLWFRLHLWDKAIGAFLANPFTGVGSGGFPRQLHDLPQIVGIKSEISSEYARHQFSPHNELLGVLSETGVVGFAPYLLWIVVILGICLDGMRFARRDIFALAASGTVMALAVSGIYAGHVNFMPISTMLLAYIMGSARGELNRV